MVSWLRLLVLYHILTYSWASWTNWSGSGVGCNLRLFARRENNELSEASDLDWVARDNSDDGGNDVGGATSDLLESSVLNMIHAIVLGLFVIVSLGTLMGEGHKKDSNTKWC